VASRGKLIIEWAYDWGISRDIPPPTAVGYGVPGRLSGTYNVSFMPSWLGVKPSDA